MQVWLSGGEVPKHRDLLAKSGAPRFAVNLASVVKERSSGLGDEETLTPFPRLFYTSQSDLEVQDFDKVLDRYLDEDSLVLGIEHPDAISAKLYVPEWYGGDVDELFELAVEHGMVAISEGVLSTEALMRPIQVFRSRNPHVRLFTTCSKAKVLAPYQHVLTDTLVSGWLSSQRHRELQVWDGSKVARYPRAARNQRIDEHRAQILNLGLDVEKIEEGDVYESMRLAVVSWLQYDKVVATAGGANLPEPSTGNVIALATDGREARKRDDLVMLPVLLPKTEEQEDVRPAVSSLRQCNLCSLNGFCPKYERDAYCGFEIPVSLRTKTELRAMLSTLLELQGQRAVMAKFEEDLMSQGVTDEASAELERFFRFAETAKRIEEDRATLTVTASQPSGAGPLSALFGDKVGEVNSALPQPVDSDSVIADAEVIDVD